MTDDLDVASRNAADATSALTILSAESLSSDLLRDKPEFALDLAARFPGARILIGIRSQYSVMRGIYHLYVKGGGTESYEAFVRARCGQLFDYARIVDAYRASFGHDNIFVLPHEDLIRVPLESMAALLRFAGVDPGIASKVYNRRVKPSAGDATMTVLRGRNRMIASLRWLWPKAHSEIVYRGLPGAGLIDRAFGNWLRLPAHRVRSAIHDAYADSNARLFASLGMNVADYDYPLPGRD